LKWTWEFTHQLFGKIAYFISFAAGVLISVSFLHLIPMSLLVTKSAPALLLLGFLFLHFINRFLNGYICNRYNNTDLVFGIIPMVGIGFHSFLDGVFYSVTYSIDLYTGTLAAIGMVLHEFPEGIVTFLLLERAGFPTKKAIWLSFFAAAVSTPIGTLVSLPFIQGVEYSSLGALLAVSAGALVYVGATHLLPAVEQENKKYSTLSLLAGVLVAIIIVILKR
jgi:zinc transporter ZupT